MSLRINVFESTPAAVKVLLGVEQYVRSSTLEAELYKLVKLRASYLNGCAFCVDMHTREARAAGETEHRLYAVPVWKETPFFSPRERAALAWTETVTELGRAGVSDEQFRAAREHFSEQELVDLTMGIIAINAWNRLAVSFGAVPGSMQPAAASKVREMAQASATEH